MTGLYDALREDHERLDALFEELLNRIHIDADAARETWTAFEQGLLAHLAAEETWLLPLFERLDPPEAEALRGEHARIRELLAEIGVGLDLHVVREEMVEAFISFLRDHAAREDSLLYRWAEESLPDAPRRSLLDVLRDTRAGADLVDLLPPAPPARARRASASS